MKPGFLPARIGVGRSLLALGLTQDADRQFDEVLRTHPDDVEAWMGKASVLGARSLPMEEIAVYRKLLAEDAGRTEARAHLLAALVDLGEWPSARGEIESMLTRTPEDPQLRFLHSVALTKTGAAPQGEAEREEARRLGLPYEREVALCEHLGLAPPPPRATVVARAAPPVTAPTSEEAPEAARPSARRGKRNGTRKRK
jgi:tetratricopeptide (TPR) repeat protein